MYLGSLATILHMQVQGRMISYRPVLNAESRSSVPARVLLLCSGDYHLLAGNTALTAAESARRPSAHHNLYLDILFSHCRSGSRQSCFGSNIPLHPESVALPSSRPSVFGEQIL